MNETYHIYRHTRRMAASMLGTHRNHFDRLCRVYLDGRLLLSDCDLDILRSRPKVGRPPRGSPPRSELQGKVRAYAKMIRGLSPRQRPSAPVLVARIPSGL